MMTVFFDKRRGKYEAQYNIYIAMFDSPELAEAAVERVKASEEMAALKEAMDEWFYRPGSGGRRFGVR